MKNSVKKEVEKLIKKLDLNCSIEEFKDKVKWNGVSYSQKLSLDFIREFKDKVNWTFISNSQKLSLDFIREFKDLVNWTFISNSQKLSLDFIREFKDLVKWNYISKYQKLSLKFIREFKDKVDIELQRKTHKTKTLKQKLKEITNYAKTHNLKINKNYLYAYRDHDQLGRGIFNKTIYYKKGKYYTDWHCDMNKDEENSFGLGIFPEGNTLVRVKIEDWGVEVDREDGKVRVWGFEVV